MKTIICKQCKKPFEVHNSEDRTFCGLKCYGLSVTVKKAKLICKVCDKEYLVKPTLKDLSKYCSKKCKNFAKTNEYKNKKL